MRCLPRYRAHHAVLWALTTIIAAWGFLAGGQDAAAAPIRVLMWDEQQPEQKRGYDRFLGEHLAEHLGNLPGLTVRSVRLDDPEQGLAADALDNCDVLIWWGHARHKEIKPERAQQIVERIKRGQLSMIALHSGHWSVPFIEAMAERARDLALANLAAEDRPGAKLETIPAPLDAPHYDSLLTPQTQYRKSIDGPVIVRLRLPGCSFPAWREKGEPSKLRVLLPDHPIAAGLPHEFMNEQDEMYDEPFHVPEPDAVVLEERWAGGGVVPQRRGVERRRGEGVLFPAGARDLSGLQIAADVEGGRKRRALAGKRAGRGQVICGGRIPRGRQKV